MKALILTMAFMAVLYFTGVIPNENVTVQIAAIIICALVLIWYALRAICCACGQGNKSGCSKRQTKRNIMNDSRW